MIRKKINKYLHFVLLISFKNCTVTYKDEILFKPEWGIYDMAIGKEIVSAYAGPADVHSFQNMGQVSETKTHKITYSEKEIELHKMYAEIAEMRSNKVATKRMQSILGVLKDNSSKIIIFFNSSIKSYSLFTFSQTISLNTCNKSKITFIICRGYSS